MPQGSIKKLVTDRGFGFIESERGDLFFHATELRDAVFEELRVGQMMDYELGRGKKGLCAVEVRPTEG